MIKIKREKLTLSREFELIMDVECIDGEKLDTQIMFTGSFAVSGSTRKVFAEKVQALVDEYLI